MLATKKIETATDSYTINDAMNVLLSKLDEAIDDLENGRVLSEEELWEEIDSIQGISMATDNYKIKYTYSSREDIREKKEYIIKTFKYRQFGKILRIRLRQLQEV